MAERPLAVGFLLFIEHVLDLRVDGQAPEHTDIGSAGVSSWDHANGGPERPYNDTSGLPHHFGYRTTRNAASQHEPMRSNARDDVTLPTDMGTFQMRKRLVEASTLQETLRLRDLSAESFL
jgi:hypothetical protein